jgi:hypothetical protein
MLEQVHGDLFGPVTPSTPSGNMLFFLLIEDLSHYMWVTLMSSKDQAKATFMTFPLELISSGLGHRGLSPPPHALIRGNSLISGQWAPLPAPISRTHKPKFTAEEIDT